MANEEHIKVILSGVEAIIAWRLEHPNEQFDLRGVSLRRAKLEHTNLTGADLREANLEWADFRWADLIDANLSGSNLARADFHKADLTNARLCKAILKMTNFEDANLCDADCTDAIFSGTRLLNTDLSGVKGLTTTQHIEKSNIDQETLDKAEELPIEFLRGCGLSDREIRATLKRLISCEVFSDFLKMASVLLEKGYKDPAAVMIGGVIDQLLRLLCQKRGVEVIQKTPEGKEIPKNAQAMNEDLKKKGVYNQLDQKNITALMDLRNKASHGQYNEYTEEQVENMHRSVSEFIRRMQE
jgi:hypothetical protein